MNFPHGLRAAALLTALSLLGCGGGDGEAAGCSPAGDKVRVGEVELEWHG